MKILSFIIPSYNSARFLDKCIGSFLDPDVTDRLDIIIVNDGSTDETPQVAQAYADRYPGCVRLINQVNKGHGGALNTLADVVGGSCACSRGDQVVTLSCTMEFLRPGRGEKIFCTARPRKMGSNVCVIGVELTDTEQKPVASGTFTYYVVKKAE